MKIVFVAEYDVPEDQWPRKISEIGEALRLPTDFDERRQLTVCVAEVADRVIGAIEPPAKETA